jgi:hypothetical protein
MRRSILLIFLLFSLFEVDYFAFDARYSAAAWATVMDEGHAYRQPLNDWFARILGPR